MNHLCNGGLEKQTGLCLKRRKPLQADVGIVGVGHHVYWTQFPGLKETLIEKKQVFMEKVSSNGVVVHDFGFLDNSQSAYEALAAMQRTPLDLLFVDMLTYATSATWAPLIRTLDIPIVLVALQPLRAMDYQNGEILIQLENDDICSLPEFAGVAVQMGKPVPPIIIGTLYDDPIAAGEIEEWCSIAKVLHDLKRARFGLMGHVLEAMYDMHVNPVLFTHTLGCHVVMVEPDDVMVHYRKVTELDIKEKSEEILQFFDTPDPVSDPVTTRLSDEHLYTAAKVAVALERFVDEKQLDGLAYYYEGEEGTEIRELVTNFIVGNSLLCSQGFPMCGEFDLKTCLGMMIMDRLGIGGSFAEFHPVDFNNNTVLVGHDGPHHINIADGKPVLRSLSKYHGKPGEGASVEFKLKTGPITMLSVSTNHSGMLKFIVAEGESIDAPIPPTGNTNTHGYFGPDIRQFLKRWMAAGPTHHYALGIGHYGATLQKIAQVLGIDFEWVV